MLPWIIAALAFAGAALWFFLRRRARPSYAAAGTGELPQAATAQPENASSTPRSSLLEKEGAPEPAKAAGSGVVSARLRPWLEIEFNPDRGVIDDEKAAVAFDLSIFNSGSAPARDVRVQATLLNAGANQDQEIQLFFDNPVTSGESIPVIAPLQRITVTTAVFLARAQVRAIVVEGRSIFVPLIAVNAVYSWGGGIGQTSTSYIVGKETGGDRLAPFRVDLGRRIFRNLAARNHALQVRK